ncbi:hypothetical protein LBMAG27_00960 [Bacteroidota bacterium]|nr:hypothetical protein LBMAG27_00960 [Bacteroidota bacterium]
MKKKELYNLIENPSSVSELPKEKLNELINQHPWFASAHLLKAKRAQLQNHSEFESILSTAAVYANNRIALFELIYPSSPEKILRTDFEIQETKSKSNGELKHPVISETIIETEIAIAQTEDLLDTIIAKEKVEEEKQSKEIFDELIVASEMESGFQIEDTDTDEVIVAGDHEEEGIMAVENAARYDKEENYSEEFEAVSQSGNLVEFVEMEIDEEANEPEIDKNEVELESTKYLDEEIERNEAEEEIKDAEVEVLSLSEYAHKNEEFESDEEGSAEENIESELESLKVLEAQNATEIIVKEKLSVSISSEINEEHSFLDWLKKLSGTIEIAESQKNIEVVSAQIISEAVSAEQEATEEALIDFTPDLLSTNNEEDLRVIDNFVHSIKEKKAEPKQSSVIDRAEKSLINSDEIVTETLARILTAQNKYQSAISMYEKLSLKLPHKSHYFAALIKELKNKL